MSGLDVARAIDGRCHVVFVTAYDEYAVAAFDEGAVDYLLKQNYDKALAYHGRCRPSENIDRRSISIASCLQSARAASQRQRDGCSQYLF